MKKPGKLPDLNWRAILSIFIYTTYKETVIQLCNKKFIPSRKISSPLAAPKVRYLLGKIGAILPLLLLK